MKRKKKHIQHKSRPSMILALAATGAALVAVIYWANRSDPAGVPVPSANQTDRQAAPTPGARIPPFHMSLAAAEPLPQTLPPAWFSNPQVARAYRVAGRIPEVLAQQPCYCWCDRFGHDSLLDCFASDHGAG